MLLLLSGVRKRSGQTNNQTLLGPEKTVCDACSRKHASRPLPGAFLPHFWDIICDTNYSGVWADNGPQIAHFENEYTVSLPRQTEYGETRARDIQHHVIMGLVTLLSFLCGVTFPSGVWLDAGKESDAIVGDRAVNANIRHARTSLAVN